MPSKRKTLYKIVAGHVSVATVDAATGIKAWAHVTNQPYSLKWLAPDLFAAAPPVKAVPRFSDGSSKPHGAYSWQWVFSGWSIGMWNYFRGEFLTTKYASAPVTTLQYDEEDDAIYIQSELHYPGSGLSELAPIAPGMYRVRLGFTNGVEIT